MDTKLEYQILIIFFSVDYNNRDNDKKQKETYAKLNNINKCMETLLGKFDNPSPNKAETNRP